MPPVLGPVSPSPSALEVLRRAASGTTVAPSVRQNSETSGPSRYSSTTTRPPRRARQAAACAAAPAPRPSVTTTPLPRGEAVVLDDVRRAERVQRPRDLGVRRADAGPARSGTSAAAMTSLAKALLPSSRAAAADGPKQAMPRSRGRRPRRRRRAAPPGPTTTRSAPSPAARSATAAGSAASTLVPPRPPAMPALPGATTTDGRRRGRRAGHGTARARGHRSRRRGLSRRPTLGGRRGKPGQACVM